MATKDSTSRASWDKLTNEQRNELEFLEWSRMYMTKTADKNVMEHVDPFGQVYTIVRNPDYTWALITPSGDAFPFRLRKECVHAVSRATAQALWDMGLEVGKYVKPVELKTKE